MAAGYSGTPLAKKLGIKKDSIILILNQPNNYVDFFSSFPDNVIIQENCENEKVEFIHIFVSTIRELEYYYSLAKSNLKKNGILWISWPKKTSKIMTEIDKFIVMKYGLDHGLVDTKVAAIDENWSGHKFVYRLKDR